ncbi:hypothetical protein OUZ56_032742 [Daphnia magna]|uniref:Uncharacterized protein n=1 Tax=Daphnia magna TaxID=35525 RepID=A0ABQ9ZX07_9CRUS|nr:hypothetical protein OUZ56_032742 [Daphnia magna]
MNPIKLRYRAQESLSGSPQLSSLKILEESSDSISLSFGGTGKVVLLVKPFRLDVYDEDQLVISVNAKGLLYHHLHYSSMLPKLINFMIESINYYLIILVPCPQSKKDGVL